MQAPSEPVPQDWEEYAKELGRRLQEARGARTQEAIAAEAGMSRPYYHGLEHGRWRGRTASPSLHALARVAQALGVDLAELIPPTSGLAVLDPPRSRPVGGDPPAPGQA
ncbi:helix-turn-helix domain-containing protein [Nocardioides litoris]|uniref:helix-turn-helix domain-containing protein n=1 Tax=Nocardioides litoris TaxID=1926648 RepID=UPI001476BF85